MHRTSLNTAPVPPTHARRMCADVDLTLQTVRLQLQAQEEVAKAAAKKAKTAHKANKQLMVSVVVCSDGTRGRVRLQPVYRVLPRGCYHR
jgi:hypothetical protein